MKRRVIVLITLFLAVSGYSGAALKGRGIWAHPRDLGKNEAEVRAFFARLSQCRIDIVFPLMKNTGGAIFWHSEKFPEAVHPDYRDFDLLRAAAKYAREYGIDIHPWLCDFTESKDSPAFQMHPEWAMLNPRGGNTSEEKLSEDRPYNPVWMCPARKPGYVDEWLMPMIEEIVRNYDIDGIHHDYVRYPGDVAPDSYCFCDFCLEHYLVYNHFYYTGRPDDRITLKRVLPREEANWHYDLSLRPEDWAKMSREEKSEYLLNGSSVNRNDLDYYFYETRVDAVSQFVKESTERARKIDPDIAVSAAVFINPMRSGRHIGQRWTDFLSWIDIMAPMNYRSHFQGSFADYLDYLEDYVRAQKKWCGGESALYPGITGQYIYREEREPWEAAMSLLDSADAGMRADELKDLLSGNIAYLKQFSPERARLLDAKCRSYFENDITKEILLREVRNILSDPPAGFFPEEKLLRTIQVVERVGAEGISIFSAGIIQRNKLWPALQKAFTQK